MSMLPVKLLLEKKTMELASAAATATKEAVEGGLESAFKTAQDMITSAADPAIATLVANLNQQTFKDNINLMNSFMLLAGSPAVGSALSTFANAINKVTIELALWSSIVARLQESTQSSGVPDWLYWLMDIFKMAPPRNPTPTGDTPYGTPWTGGNIGGGHAIQFD